MSENGQLQSPFEALFSQNSEAFLMETAVKIISKEKDTPRLQEWDIFRGNVSLEGSEKYLATCLLCQKNYRWLTHWKPFLSWISCSTKKVFLQIQILSTNKLSSYFKITISCAPIPCRNLIQNMHCLDSPDLTIICHF